MRNSKFVLILTSLLAASAVSPVLAAPSDLELAAAADAERRGAQLFAYDQAAWHATDRFQADLAAASISNEELDTANLQGYIAEPADGGGVLVTFYSQRDDTRSAYARYLYVDGIISGEGILAEGVDKALSPLALRIATAREKAIAEMRKPEHGLCSDTPPNTLVVPVETQGATAAYVLTSTTDANSFPAGGHYRFDFDAAGNLTGERRFMRSCFPIDWSEKDGNRPEILFVTHLLDPQPTEIHAFVSRNIPIGLGVITSSNNAVWAITNGRIRYARDVDKGK